MRRLWLAVLFLAAGCMSAPAPDNAASGSGPVLLARQEFALLPDDDGALGVYPPPWTASLLVNVTMDAGAAMRFVLHGLPGCEGSVIPGRGPRPLVAPMSAHVACAAPSTLVTLAWNATGPGLGAIGVYAVPR